MRRIILCIVVGIASCSTGVTRHDGRIAVLERQPLAVARGAAASPLGLSVTLAYFDYAWRSEAIASALSESARIRAQCGVALSSAELVRIEAPPRFRDLMSRSRAPRLTQTVSASSGRVPLFARAARRAQTGFSGRSRQALDDRAGDPAARAVAAADELL